jgi:hypothetical protein
MKNLKKLVVLGVLLGLVSFVAISCDTGVGPVATSSAGSNSESGTSEKENEPGGNVSSGEESNQVDEKIYYTVTFKCGDWKEEQRLEAGQKITLPDAPVFDNAEFAGWETSSGIPVDENTVASESVASSYSGVTIKGLYNYAEFEIARGTFVCADFSEEQYNVFASSPTLNERDDYYMAIFGGKILYAAKEKIYADGFWMDTIEHYDTYRYFADTDFSTNTNTRIRTDDEGNVYEEKRYYYRIENTYDYAYINEPDLNSLFLEVVGEQGLEMIATDNSYYIVVNYDYKSPELHDTWTRHRYLEGFTWIIIKYIGTYTNRPIPESIILL